MEYITYSLKWRRNPHAPADSGIDEGVAPFVIVDAVGATWEPGFCVDSTGRRLGYITGGSAASIAAHPGAADYSIAVEAAPLAWGRAACLSMGMAQAEVDAYYLDADGRIAGYPEDDER